MSSRPRKSDTETRSGGGMNGTWNLSYDAENRMTCVSAPTGPYTLYGYDGAGNRTSVATGPHDGTNQCTAPTSTVTTTYSATTGLPTSATDGTAYTYDKVGNLTNTTGGPNPALTMAYDSWNQMTAAGALAYTYDGLGRLTSVGGTSYAYQGSSHDLITQTTGSTVTNYAYGSEGAIAQSSGSSTSYLLSDLHGDVVGTTAVGATSPSATTTFAPYGTIANTTGTSSLLGFQGQPTDPATGFTRTQSRLYNPLMGSFTSRDSLFGSASDPTSLNQYAYGADSPVGMSDPSGAQFRPDKGGDKNHVGPVAQGYQECWPGYWISDQYTCPTRSGGSTTGEVGAGSTVVSQVLP